MNVQQRILIEHQITIELCQSILDNGFVLVVDNGGDINEMFIDAEDAADEATATDESWIYAYDDKGHQLACFFLVYGNDGFDCLADHSVNDHTTKILETVEPLIEQLEELYA